MSTTPSFHDLIAPGAQGDAEVNVRLTARQVSALQLVVSIGEQLGAGHLAYLGAHKGDIAEHFRLAFQEAQARIGLALAGAIDPEWRTTFSAEIARLEQEKAALEEGV